MATQLKEPEEQIEEAPTVEAETPEPRDFDREARDHGWVPKEDFKGDASRWVDAETFMKRADEVMPLLRKQNEHLKRELADVKKQARRITDHFNKAEERIRAEIMEEMEAAVEAGDVEEFRKLRKKSDALGGEAAKPQAASAEEAREAFDDWRESNPWYDKANLASASEVEIAARLYADRMTEKHVDKTKDMAPAEFFSFIGGLVLEKYPTVNSAGKPPRQRPPSDVAPATPGRGGARGKTWADMEPEERRIGEQMAEKWVRQGLLKKKDDFLLTYDWNKR